GASLLIAAPALAQSAPTGNKLIVRVVLDTIGVDDATVSAGRTTTRSDANGVATLRLPAGSYAVRVNKLGFRPETAFVQLSSARDTAITVSLLEQPARISPILVSSTRAERRLEQEPLRVEVLAGDDITEKNEM